MTALVSYQLADGVATLAMDDGKANVMSPSMIAELNAALDRAQADRAAVLLTGRPGMFSGGFDLKVMGTGGENAYNMLMGGFRLAERLLSFPAPVVIACNGHALAMGVFLLLAGDYRIGVDGAFKIGANEVAIGLNMPSTATEMCRQRLTPAHFSLALLTSEIYTPANAVAAGFLERVVPEADLQAEARSTALRLAKLSRAAYTATKALARENSLKAVRAGIEADAAAFRALAGPKK